MLNLAVTTLKGGRETLLHRVEIVNDQTGTPEVGHYRVRVTGLGRPLQVRVEGHDRADGALRLAYEVLRLTCAASAVQTLTSHCQGVINTRCLECQ